MARLGFEAGHDPTSAVTPPNAHRSGHAAGVVVRLFGASGKYIPNQNSGADAEFRTSAPVQEKCSGICSRRDIDCDFGAPSVPTSYQ
jgi:hypothetical protein